MAQLHSSRGKLIAKSSLFSSMLLGLELLALHFSEPLASLDTQPVLPNNGTIQGFERLSLNVEKGE